MNNRIIGLVLIILLAAQFACLSTTPTPEPPAEEPTSVPPIGKVNKIQGSVQAGPESALEEVDPERDMNNNDAIQIKDNGKASLDFGHGLAFTLYNNTTSSGTSVDRSSTALQVTTRLSAGGLKGYTPSGKRTEVLLPNEAKIIILGTDYFVTYDPKTDIAWAYNLNGRVQYALPGGNLQDLEPRSLVEFNSTEVIEVYEDLTFSTDDFDKYATQFNSPILGVEELLKVSLPTETPASTPTFAPSPTNTFTPTYTPTFTPTSTSTLPPTITPTSTSTSEPLTEIYRKYLALGGPNGFLGNPVGPEKSMRDGSGNYRDFQGGSIYWSPQTGAHEVHGEILARWLAIGGVGFFGYPVTDETTTPDGIGRYTHFQGGSIYWSPNTGAHDVYGLIREKWAGLGWERSFLGYPTTGETSTPKTPAGQEGRFNHFQGGSIYWSSQTGAHEVHGFIRELWANLGWEQSCLGFPTSDEQDFSDPGGQYTRISYFQGGHIVWGPRVGASHFCTQIIR